MANCPKFPAHNGRNGVSNHQPYDCLLNRLFRRRSKKTSKIRVTGLCAGNSPVTGEFPAQRASNAENVSIWWRHHATLDRVHNHSNWYTFLIRVACTTMNRLWIWTICFVVREDKGCPLWVFRLIFILLTSLLFWAHTVVSWPNPRQWVILHTPIRWW